MRADVDALLERMPEAHVGYAMSLFIHQIIAPLPTTPAGYARILGITLVQWAPLEKTVLPLLKALIADEAKRKRSNP